MVIFCHLNKGFSLNKFHQYFSYGLTRRCFSSSSRSPLLYVPPRLCLDDSVDELVSESWPADHDDYFHFFNPAEQTKIQVPKKQYIPGQKEILSTRDDANCCGSSHGWLAFLNPSNSVAFLYNPRLQYSSHHVPYIPLPPYETFPGVKCSLRAQKSSLLSPSPSLVKDFMFKGNNHRFADDEMSVHSIEKFALSSAPLLPRSSSLRDCCMLMLTGSDRDCLHFSTLGEERWHTLEEEDPWRRYIEIMYFGKHQLFYAITKDSSIVAWDLTDTSCPKRREIIRLPWSSRPRKTIGSLNYLVECSGDLLLVERFLRKPDRVKYHFRTLSFHVSKLNFDENKWEPVECIGDQALFVGRNHSFSLSATDHPGLSKNSIYFAVDTLCVQYEGHDSGVFHLKDNSITTYHSYRNTIILCKPHPLWVAPN